METYIKSIITSFRFLRFESTMNLSRVKKSTLVRSTLYRSTTHNALQLERR